VNAVSTHRRYQLKARADRQRQTRERIVAATSELHREVGPARTTIADIARRAGVERLTVYNNFPELSDLLRSCQAHFLAGSPPPDILPARSGESATARLEDALAAQYRWYRANEAMERNVHRDRHLVPELDALMRQHADPALDRAADAYAALIGKSPHAVRSVRQLVRVALDFRTWQLLASSHVSDRAGARLMAGAVTAVAAG
jgi:AcrR family transcriptional regulator